MPIVETALTASPIHDTILCFLKRFQGIVYAVMFKKHLIKILYTNVFTENVYLTNIDKITEEARFDWRRFLSIYKISEEMKVMLEMFFKYSS